MVETFVPTRYLSYSYADDGSLILASTLTGAIGAVPPAQAGEVRTALRRTARHAAPLEGLTKDLEHGGFLIPEGTDERELSRLSYLERYRDESLHLILLPTEQCNFRCIYCYESFKRGEMMPEIREGIKRFVSSQKQLRQLQISWFGGEPLLARNTVLDLARFFNDYSSAHGISLSVSATTNGYCLTPDLADELIPLGVREFQISIDGVREEHNRRRALEGTGDTFDRILENLRYLKLSDHLFVVMIRNNFDANNMSRIEEFIDLLRTEFECDPRFSVFFFPVGRLGGTNDIDLPVCENRELSDAYLRGKRLALQAGLRNALQIERFRPNGHVCYAANPRSFVIGSDGAVYKCTVELDYHDRNVVGHLGTDGTMRLDWKKMALWTETNGMEPGKKCWSCFYSPSCHGAACPKDWLDAPECNCPPEKMNVRQLLPIIYEQEARGLRSPLDTAVQCTR